MQTTNHFLKAAFQIGPWRITRKVLLFVIVFCVVVILFGTVVLKTHMFDEDWEDIDWDDDDDWEDGVSGGDSILLIIIGLAGVGVLMSSIGCCMASLNSPEQFTNNGSVFTLRGVTQSDSTASAPQAVPRQPREPRHHHSNHVRRPRPEEIKSHPPPTDYPQGPSYPVNPGYPPHPPPYSAPGFPPGGMPNNARVAPTPHTIADLPPPYAPGPYPNPR